jgi:translation initiation factor RLI1
LEQENKQHLIEELLSTFGKEGLKAQIDLENQLLDVFEKLMSENNVLTKEYKNAKSEYTKQTKVLEYFSSEEFEKYYLDLYREQLQSFDIEEIQYLLLQQKISKKVNNMSKNISEAVCNVADAVAGDLKLDA